MRVETTFLWMSDLFSGGETVTLVRVKTGCVAYEISFRRYLFFSRPCIVKLYSVCPLPKNSGFKGLGY